MERTNADIPDLYTRPLLIFHRKTIHISMTALTENHIAPASRRIDWDHGAA
jgi:hypothetical protein